MWENQISCSFFDLRSSHSLNRNVLKSWFLLVIVSSGLCRIAFARPRCVHVCSELIRVAPSPLTWSRLECSDLCRCTNPICPPHAFGFVRGGSRKICPGWPTGFVTGVRFGFVLSLDLDLSRVSGELIGATRLKQGRINFISSVR